MDLNEAFERHKALEEEKAFGQGLLNKPNTQCAITECNCSPTKQTIKDDTSCEQKEESPLTQ